MGRLSRPNAQCKNRVGETSSMLAVTLEMEAAWKSSGSALSRAWPWSSLSSSSSSSEAEEPEEEEADGDDMISQKPTEPFRPSYVSACFYVSNTKCGNFVDAVLSTFKRREKATELPECPTRKRTEHAAGV